jgi:hypothetical protein
MEKTINSTLRELCTRILQDHNINGTTGIRKDFQRLLNQELKQDMDYINKVEFDFKGLVLKSEKEIIKFFKTDGSMKTELKITKI